MAKIITVNRELDEAKRKWNELTEEKQDYYRAVAKKEYPEWDNCSERIESMALAMFKRDMKEGE